MKYLSRHLSTVVVVLCVGGIATIVGADVLSDLGVPEGRAREAVFDSLVSGAVSIVGNPATFKAASPQVRVTMVKTLIALARSYVETDDFARRYADHREVNGPGSSSSGDHR